MFKKNKSRHCEYCEDIKIGISNWDAECMAEIRKILDKNVLVFTNCGNKYRYAYFKINYCPICGRKLK